MSDPDETPAPRDPLDVPDTPWWSATPLTPSMNPGTGTDPVIGSDADAASDADSPAGSDAGRGWENETGALAAGPGTPPFDPRGAVPVEPVTPPADPFLPGTLPSDPFGPFGPSEFSGPSGPRYPDGFPVQSPLDDADEAVPLPAAVTAGGDRNLPTVIAGGAVAAVLIAAIAFAGLRALSGPRDQDGATARSAASATPRPSDPAADPSKPAFASIIDSERTDPRPLSLREVFPDARILLGGRPYRRDLTSVNRQCELTARGALAVALERGRCRGVIRATFADGTKYAVTTGIAIMPTRAAAVAASRSGDPARYEWFRGMRGEIATKIDQAGGYASSTVRGRYIIYAYAQYADGTRPRATDPALKSLAGRFIAYTVRPIDQRARA